MTEQERINEAQARLQALCAELGVTLHSTVNAKQYGDMVQIEPGDKINIIAVPNWQPPAQQPQVVLDTHLLEKNYIGIVQNGSDKK